MSTFRIDQQGGGDFQTIAQALRHCLLAREKAPVLRLGPGCGGKSSFCASPA